MFHIYHDGRNIFKNILFLRTQGRCKYFARINQRISREDYRASDLAIQIYSTLGTTFPEKITKRSHLPSKCKRKKISFNT